MKIRLAMFLILSGLTFSKDGYSAEPPQPQHHKLFSKRNITLFAIDAASRGVDAGQTCYHLSRGWHEQVLPTQSCAGAVAYLGGAVAGEITLSAIFHHMGWHRAEWLPPLTGATLSAVGTIKSEK